jgi:hypothetical protein
VPLLAPGGSPPLAVICQMKKRAIVARAHTRHALDTWRTIIVLITSSTGQEPPLIQGYYGTTPQAEREIVVLSLPVSDPDVWNPATREVEIIHVEVAM